MSWTSAFQFAAAFIVSLGGGAAIVFGLSSYLGKLWADRALEKERHKYADILQSAKSELDKATNRYQVQLDSLTLVHKLRTTEEFVRLGHLWRHMATLQDAFHATAGLGLTVLPADAEERQRHKHALRREYELALQEGYKFFLEEKLFIPKVIAGCAETTLWGAIKEKNCYDIFFLHDEASVRSNYTNGIRVFLDDFDAGMAKLEVLMRDHIEGTRLDSRQDEGMEPIPVPLRNSSTKT